jgi:hypothetical protein
MVSVLWIRRGLCAAVLCAAVAAGAQGTTDAAKTVVVVSSENSKISGQLFHPKMCPNMLNQVAFVRPSPRTTRMN